MEVKNPTDTKNYFHMSKVNRIWPRIPKGGGEAEGKETENEKLNSPRLSVAMSASMWALLHFILHRDMNFSYIKSQLYLQLFFDLQDQMVSKKDLFKPL